MRNNNSWISIAEIAQQRQVHENALSAFFADFHIAPVFDVGGVACLLADDAQELGEMISACKPLIDTSWGAGGQIRHISGVEIWIGAQAQECGSFGVALRNLWRRLDRGNAFGDLSVECFAGSLLRRVNDDMAAFVGAQGGRVSWLSSEQSRMFGRSVSYLGSKLAILDFVMEVASRFVNREDARLLDAMCGSGL